MYTKRPALILFVYILQYVDKPVRGQSDDFWDGLNLKYGIHKELPRRSSDAVREGYKRQNNVCKTRGYHGFLYKIQGDTKMIPIYDLNGKLGGIQATIPGKMMGYNSLNQSIDLPPTEIMPPVLLSSDPYNPRVHSYSITAYFKHPEFMCNPFPKSNVTSGKGLYLQTGYDPIKYNIRIPMKSKYLTSVWKKAGCLPSMGLHYVYNITRDMPCEKLYPLFLMYDNEGKLGAFGWSFQGNPLDSGNSLVSWFKLLKETFYFVFDPEQLPSCMFVPGFKVFGIHIWLQSHERHSMRSCQQIKESNSSLLQERSTTFQKKSNSPLNTISAQRDTAANNAASRTFPRISVINFYFFFNLLNLVLFYIIKLNIL